MIKHMNKITWSNKARKQIKRIPEALKLFAKINDELIDFSDSKNVKKLTKHDHDYRLRVGRYRVLFDYANEIKIVEIVEVKKRDDRTY